MPKKYEALSQLLIAKIFAIISGIFIISTIQKTYIYVWLSKITYENKITHGRGKVKDYVKNRTIW
jgi:hypothetical protein